MRWAATVFAVAVCYFASAKLGLSLAFTTKQVTAVWPPTGVAFVALLLLGYRVWPGIYLGAFLANLTAGEAWTTAAGIAIGNTFAIVVGVLGTRRLVSDQLRLTRLRDVVVLVGVGATLACLVSATAGVANLAWGGLVAWADYWSVWWVWWIGDALGVLLFTPFLLAWLERDQPRSSPRQLLGLAALLVALVALCQVVFAGEVVASEHLVRLEYTVFPFIIWTAVRFGQREATSVAVLISAFAIWGAIHGRGPYATGAIDQRLLQLDVFMGIVMTTALALSAVVAQRRDAERALAAARDELEDRVRERTLELAESNTELAQKNEEVEAFVYIVSHDLRAPLVNLQGFSKELSLSCQELSGHLADAELPAAVATPVQSILQSDIPGALRFISASTSRFQRLIDALLMLSRYGRQSYRSEMVDVDALVQTTLDSLRQSILNADVEIEVAGLPVARGDTTAIGQVFSNLIANAINYLEPGRPGRIRIRGELKSGMCHYAVSDNGAGIPESARPRLFQVFQRFHPERAQGEGMGLAIVKRVVERHGGTVSAESQEGVGTTFLFSLPAATLGEES